MPSGVYTHRPMSEEHKRKISESTKGKKRSLRFRKKMSLLMKNNKNGLGSKHPHTIETKNKISNSNKGKTAGEKNYNWRGENVKYRGLHMWVVKENGRPKFCCNCGAKGEYTGKKRGQWSICWANKDHEYKRKLEDFLPLCRKCHKDYDKKLKNKN